MFKILTINPHHFWLPHAIFNSLNHHLFIKTKDKSFECYLWGNHDSPRPLNWQTWDTCKITSLAHFSKESKVYCYRIHQGAQPWALNHIDIAFLHSSTGVVALTLLMAISWIVPGSSVVENEDYNTLLTDFNENVKSYKKDCVETPNLWILMWSEISDRLFAALDFKPLDHENPYKKTLHITQGTVKQDYDFNFNEQPVQKWKYLLELRAWIEFLEEYGPMWAVVSEEPETFTSEGTFLDYRKWLILSSVDYEGHEKLVLPIPQAFEDLIKKKKLSSKDLTDAKNNWFANKENKRILIERYWAEDRGVLLLNERTFYEHGNSRLDWSFSQQFRAWHKFVSIHKNRFYKEWELQEFCKVPFVKSWLHRSSRPVYKVSKTESLLPHTSELTRNRRCHSVDLPSLEEDISTQRIDSTPSDTTSSKSSVSKARPKALMFTSS